MAEQYFAPDPSAPHDERLLTARALGLELRFFTDSATFSRDGLDEGSRLLLESLPPLSGHIADLGCGWGAIGCFLAAKNELAQLLMVDVNRRAVELARRNIVQNGIRNARAEEGDGLVCLSEGLDTVVTNPPIRAGKKIIYGLFAAAEKSLLPGGELYLVIRKSHGAESAKTYLETLFKQVERIQRDKGFWVLRCKKAE